MTEICCICQEETCASMSVSHTKVGTPPILIKNLLLEYWTLDKLPSGVLKNEDDNASSYICSYCQAILIEFYEATLCVAIKRNEFQRRFKDPKSPEPKRDSSLNVAKTGRVQDNSIHNSDEDFDDDWSDGSWTEEERHTAKLPNNTQQNLEENEPLSAVRDKLQTQRANRYCRECEVECPSEEVFKLHVNKFHAADISNRTSKVNFFCTLCKVELNSEDEYRVHMVHVHQRGSEFHCDTCGRSFNTHTQLVTHIATHKPHTCTICGKTLSHRRGLLRHMETHNAEKKHQCAECGNKYPTRASLKKHMMIHTDTRNHECPTCGNRFRSASHLKRHQSTHTSHAPKDHICLLCSKQFSTQSTLTAHMKDHNKPFTALYERSHNC